MDRRKFTINGLLGAATAALPNNLIFDPKAAHAAQIVVDESNILKRQYAYHEDLLNDVDLFLKTEFDTYRHGLIQFVCEDYNKLIFNRFWHLVLSTPDDQKKFFSSMFESINILRNIHKPIYVDFSYWELQDQEDHYKFYRYSCSPRNFL